METVLVTGGAGYIGSHTVKVLLEKGYKVVVLDDLSTGHRNAVCTEHFYLGDIADQELVSKIVNDHQITSVIHFAAKSLVGESMKSPDLYFINNVGKSVQFFSTLVSCGVKHIVFSSTAAVYGIPETIPIPEGTLPNPINPYGESKLMVEKTLRWMEEAYDVKWCALRYFNAAGADLNGDLGEDHFPETHLIPLVLKTALGQRDEIQIYGTDYETPDGTCIRDYIHVLDLAEAHIRVLEGLKNGLKSGAYNVGTGHGYSVREVIQLAQKIVGKEIKVREAARREGDPAVLVAKVDKIQEQVGWKPRYSDLETIISTAWKWHSKL
ncbi:UDP-glucose 4-epimerase GalE [Microaerobacter geothermalis]|uniref:UDP-glucose 4-epimerase GalE n=1 Tax=Microaerobacter geothermalis TaxID=674972 RepID=UPI001F2074DB|nr:UDP-glucose 4-epimerase GalE [Microaerobacter geothermalis]MCF6093272.1 UDP-glucose 4-epimerase GalE [Microaerobacter geothermalis]